MIKSYLIVKQNKREQADECQRVRNEGDDEGGERRGR
jgi:hypothetical protein